MPDSFYRNLLLEGRNKVLRELAELASRDRPAADARRYAAEAQQLLRNLAELDDKLAAPMGPSGLDYRGHPELNVSIVRYLEHIKRPATEAELTKELIRGQFEGYENAYKMAIRVGRCVRSYVVGKPSDNPKLKVRHGLVGLAEWPDSMFPKPEKK